MGLTWSLSSPPPISGRVDASALKLPFDAVIMKNQILAACFWMNHSVCFLHRWRFTFYLYIFTYGVRFLKKVNNLFFYWSVWSSKSFMIDMSIHPLFCSAFSLRVCIKYLTGCCQAEKMCLLTALSNRWSVTVFFIYLFAITTTKCSTHAVILCAAFHHLLGVLRSEHADKMKLERCQLWLDFVFIYCVVLCAEKQL